MKKFAIAALGTAALYLVATGEAGPPGAASRALAFAPAPDTVANSVIQTVCTRCHNNSRRAGNRSFLEFDATAPQADPETAEQMIRKLRAGMMPPPGIRRPEEATLTAVVEELETRMDAAAAANPNPGTRTFQRLNRAEYRRAVQGLLDLDVDMEAFLPTETISDNFDNIADVQMMSATLMEG